MTTRFPTCSAQMDKKQHAYYHTPYYVLGIPAFINKVGEAVIPSRVTTKHLTCITLAWAAMILVLYKQWPYIIPVGILAWIVTDTWDGHMGRLRDEGYVRWGYFADHSFDYLIFVTVVFAVSDLMPDASNKALVLYIGTLLIFHMIMSLLSLSSKDGLDTAMCLSERLHIYIGNTDGLLLIVVLLFAIIDPENKQIVVSVLHTRIAAAGVTCLTALRFFRIQHNLSEKDRRLHALRTGAT